MPESWLYRCDYCYRTCEWSGTGTPTLISPTGQLSNKCPQCSQENVNG